MSDSFATLWTVAHQAPLSMEFCRQEYWSVYDQEPMHNMNYHLFLVMPKMYNIYFNKLRHFKKTKEYWSGFPFPSPGNLPHLGIKPVSSAWQVDSLPLSHLGSPVLH